MSVEGPSNCVICGSSHHQRLFEKGGVVYWSCVGCGVEVTWPLPSVEDLSAYYEASYEAGLYKPFVETKGLLQKRARVRLHQVLPYAQRGRWLDIGCAKGDFVEAASFVEGVEAMGIEVAERAVALARAAGRNVVSSSIEAFRAEEPFDTLTAFDVIEHTVDPRIFLRAALTLLRPGGSLIITTPNTASLSRRLLGADWYFYLPGEHIYHFDKSNLRQIMEQEGFRVVKVSGVAKHVSFDYSLAEFQETSPAMFKLGKAVRPLIPRSLREMLVPLRLGEILAVATKPEHA